MTPEEEDHHRNRKNLKNKRVYCDVDPSLKFNLVVKDFYSKFCRNDSSSEIFFDSAGRNKNGSNNNLEQVTLDSVFELFDNLKEQGDSRSYFLLSKQLKKGETHIVQVQRSQLKWTKELSELCHLSKNLYNHTNYLARELFFDLIKKNHTYINESLCNTLYGKVKDSVHYTSLNAQTAILIIKHLADRWIGYKEAVNKWYQDPSQFPGGKKPSIPGYKPKNGEFLVIFPIQNLQCIGYRSHFEQSKKVYRWRDKNGGLHSKTTAEIKFPKKAKIPPVRFRVDVHGQELNLDNIIEFRISPRKDHYLFQVVYEKKIDNLQLDTNRAIGIDLGVNNLLTIANNFGAHPVIVKGKKIKYANWLGNKQDAKIKKKFYEKLDDKLLYFLDLYLNKSDRASIIQTFNYLLEESLFKEDINRSIIHHINAVLSINGKLKKSSKEYYRNVETKTMLDFYLVLLNASQLQEIEHHIEEITRFILNYEKIRIRNWNNRNNRIQDQIHKASRYLIDYCKENNIGRIVIGYNEGWKQGMILGKKTTQNFAFIPFLDLVEKIKYKATLVGIKIVRVDESHTSKCSALDFEAIAHHNIYMGKRINRGLFCSKDGLFINADVNAAFNILRVGIEGILNENRSNEKNLKLMLLSPISIVI